MPQDPALAETVEFIPAAGTYYRRGDALQPSGSDPAVMIPVPSGVNGSPTMLNKRDFQTDGNGRISTGSPAIGSDSAGSVSFLAEAYVTGIFRTQDLKQTGAGAVAAAYVVPGNARDNWGGRLLEGSLTAGRMSIG